MTKKDGRLSPVLHSRHPAQRHVRFDVAVGLDVVVELDEQAVFPRDYPSILIQDGARVEIVTLAAGG